MKLVLPLKLVAPLALGMVASLAIALYAELGYRRLEVANRQMATALELQASLHEALALVVDAETGQRGYLLTGKKEYLAPYENALPKIGSTFNRLREMLVTYGTPEERHALGRLNSLVGQKLAELETALALYRRSGDTAAQALLDTGIGRRAMDDIRLEVDAMTAAQQAQLTAAMHRWSDDVAFARLGMQIMTGFTIALLLVVWLLARRDAQQREARRRTMVEDKRRLESEVEQRTAELSELSSYLQRVREDEKSKLARDIHDELGGILVSAKMDVAWVEDYLRKRKDPQITAKLERALQALDDGVQIKRRIIEDLRPTMLDNLGLSAALDWQVREVCDRAGLVCTIDTPADDSGIPSEIAIALYRILQEALTNIVKYAQAKTVRVDLGVTSTDITLLIEDDGIGIPDDAQANLLSHGIAGMRQRVRALHGEFAISRRPERGTLIEVNVPLPAPRTGHPAPATADAPAGITPP
ncbi:MAG: CHASE3 domain-containing protein [Burkholderiales bacterium]|nr:CHASE3 domain-containing protein [Burkholderiales bacterium]